MNTASPDQSSVLRQTSKCVVSSCCINSAAMLQIADGDDHTPEQRKRFRAFNESQAKQLFAAANIAEEMLAALDCITQAAIDGEFHSGGVGNLHPLIVKARAAIAKATGG